MEKQLLTVNIFNGFLLPHEGKDLSTLTLPVFVAYLKSAGSRYTAKLSSVEVASLVIAFANRRKIKSLISKGLVLLLCEHALTIRKRNRTITYDALLNKHCLHQDTIATVVTTDMEAVDKQSLIDELKRAEQGLRNCVDRLNLFSDAYLHVIHHRDITQKLINQYLRSGILTVLRREYNEIVFTDGDNVAVTLRKILKHPRQDDSPVLMLKVNRYADVVSLAA